MGFSLLRSFLELRIEEIKLQVCFRKMLDVCFVKIVYDGFLVDKERGKGKFTKKTSDDHRHENIPVGVFLQHHQKRCRRTASAPAVKDRALPGELRISESRGIHVLFLE